MPAPISSKKGENDVLFTTARYHQAVNDAIDYTFLFVVPYSNAFLARISDKWREYFELTKKGYFIYDGKRVEVVAFPGFKRDALLKRFFLWFTVLKYRNKIKALVDRKNFDLIHAHNVSADAALAHYIWKEHKIPYVVTTRDVHRTRITRFIRRNLRDAKALISLNQVLKRNADQFNSRSYFIPHGVSEVFFEGAQKDIHARKMKLVTVSRLLDWKNIDKLLIALEQVNFDFQYDIYGDGPFKKELKRVLSGLRIKDKVCFKGVIPYEEMAQTLSDYHLFMLISFPETFGRVYVEAMAAGIPVVAARGCGMDGIIQDGVHGFLVDHNDSEMLSRRLIEINTDRNKLSMMGEQAKALAHEFSWTSVVAQLDRIYEDTKQAM